MGKFKGVGVSLLVFGALLLGACNGDDSSSGADQNTSAQTGNVDVENVSEEDKRGGTYTIASPASPPSLDPHMTSSYYATNFMGLSYSKLVTYETGPDMDYTDFNIVPDLAESWDVSDDHLVYTFHLRETTWHDLPPVNGRPFVADDVVATMERIISTPGHQAAMLEFVEDITAIDDRTVEFTLSQPYAPFINLLATHFMWILPEEAANGEIDLDTTMIGTGPFVLEDFEQNIQGTFVRNPNYYEEGKPYLDTVYYRTIPDQGARISAFRTGNVHAIGQQSPEDIEALQRSDENMKINERIMPTQSQVYMNVTKEPFDDLNVRKAISMAIDRQRAVDQIFGGGEVSAPVNPSLGAWSLSLEEREELQPYDPEQAKELLAEAGYPDGFDTSIMVTDGYGEEVVRLAQWIAEDLRTIGINAEIEMVEYATYYTERWPNLNYDIGVGYQTWLEEADRWLTSQYGTDEAMNWFGVSDPDLDEMLDEQRLIQDEDERIDKVHDIQRYILDEVVNPIPLMTNTMLIPEPANVHDVFPHASYGNIHLKDVWIEDK